MTVQRVGNSAFIAPDFKITDFNGKASGLVGAYGGWLAEQTFLIGAGRAGFRGGFDPAHDGVIRQFARADGVTMQGIRADAPDLAQELADAFRAAKARAGERS